jgi:hypothetical protein
MPLKADIRAKNLKNPDIDAKGADINAKAIFFLINKNEVY